MKHQILNLHLPKVINAKNAQIPQLFPFWKHPLTKEGR
ncbi:Uncharacterised protein [Helicobacter cholecystus]|nr:Uncharacterised protein [Helicobacter cholecystus]